MAPSVPVSEETRARLDSLQSEIERETGRSVTTPELLSRIVERAWADKDSIIDSFRNQ